MIIKPLVISALLACCGCLSCFADDTLPTSQQAAEEVIEKLNINQATAEEIAERLYGVGLVKAQAIVEYRNANGQFHSLEELIQVKGIGSAIVERNKTILQL